MIHVLGIACAYDNVHFAWAMQTVSTMITAHANSNTIASSESCHISKMELQTICVKNIYTYSFFSKINIAVEYRESIAFNSSDTSSPMTCVLSHHYQRWTSCGNQDLFNWSDDTLKVNWSDVSHLSLCLEAHCYVVTSEPSAAKEHLLYLCSSEIVQSVVPRFMKISGSHRDTLTILEQQRK